MKHLEYKDTNNKAFKTYYDKFKKMVKSDLNGDGWFLLVNDFPFKDGNNLMFTAGEDIGKWKDKNLVSLYGKTNYIIGRCRKKGPVLSLLHFQEGDYIKQATESGLRKQLKEYFQGTGVSTRIFKSVKVTDPDPDVSDTELEEETLPVEEQATTDISFETVAVPEPKPASVKEAIGKLVEIAEKLGVKGEQEFISLMTNFQKSVPSGPRMKMTIGKLNEYFEGLSESSQETTTTSPTEETSPDNEKLIEFISEINAFELDLSEVEPVYSELEVEMPRVTSKVKYAEMEELATRAAAKIKTQLGLVNSVLKKGAGVKGELKGEELAKWQQLEKATENLNTQEAYTIEVLQNLEVLNQRYTEERTRIKEIVTALNDRDFQHMPPPPDDLTEIRKAYKKLPNHDKDTASVYTELMVRSELLWKKLNLMADMIGDRDPAAMSIEEIEELNEKINPILQEYKTTAALAV